ncbi:MAG: hypothetical protein H7Z42_04240, partial [Roseiflexaceae bacterium]|nr:hypothetical protein [Roseiflexaceae bacterium]
DTVTVDSNTIAPLVEARADHQPAQISVVLLRENEQTRIASLFAPDGNDVVQPYFQNTVRRGAEQEYELYSVPVDAQVALAGRWQANVERPEGGPVTLVTLSRSRLRLSLQAPVAQRDDDDSTLRYVPVGRPLLLTSGAQVARPRKVLEAVSTPFVYSWVTGMSPMAQVIAPQPGEALALRDDGIGLDASAQDGRYTALHPPFTQPGDYTLQVEMPTRTEQPIHIDKLYTVRVADLPTMTIRMPPTAATLPVNQPFEALIELPGRADFQVDEVVFPLATVERPDGALDPLQIAPTGDGRYRFSYNPSFSGAYTLRFGAEVRGRGPMGSVRYIDYAEAQAAVPEAVPTIAISGAFTDTLTYDRRGALNIPLAINSQANTAEKLTIELVGIEGGEVVPNELLASPNEIGQRTVTVRLPPDVRPDEGQLQLRISSPQRRVIVAGEQIGVPFTAPPSLLLPMLLLLAILGGGGFYGYRRWKKQRVRAMLMPHTPRRLT